MPGRTRCFPFWQEFSKVSRWRLPLIQCYASADAPQDCVAQKDDYLECLHRTKEVGPLGTR
jgi:NADH dehydrogenase (ubiquinone) Fe-S protein 5